MPTNNNEIHVFHNILELIFQPSIICFSAYNNEISTFHNILELVFFEILKYSIRVVKGQIINENEWRWQCKHENKVKYKWSKWKQLTPNFKNQKYTLV